MAIFICTQKTNAGMGAGIGNDPKGSLTLSTLHAFFILLKGGEMDLTWKLFIFVSFICISMGIVGSPILKKLHEISDKLGETNHLIRDGIKKLDEIELKM